jgi:hypothetical protein
MSSILGWVGSVALAVCGAEEAYKAFLFKRCDIGWFMLGAWQLGEVCTLLAILGDAPLGYLIFNYGLNIFFISVMIYYKRKSNDNFN